MDPVTIGKRIKQYYPDYADVDDAELGNKYLQKYGAAAESVKGGYQTIQQLPEKQRTAVGAFGKELGLEPTAKEETKPEEVRKQEQKLGTIEVSVSELEKQLNQIGGASRGKLGGTLGKLLAGATGGEVATDVADYEALRKALIGPLARGISGEVGVLTDRDIARAEGLLPKVTDAKKLAKRKLDNLRSLIYAQRGATGGLPSLSSFEE